jgi:hypothetical protein
MLTQEVNVTVPSVSASAEGEDATAADMRPQQTLGGRRANESQKHQERQKGEIHGNKS